MTKSRLPCPSSDKTDKYPLCICMICLEILSPIPELEGLVVKNRIKIRSWTSTCMPVPLSLARIKVLPSSLMPADSSIRGLEQWRVASKAFSIRLISTCSIRPLSAITCRCAVVGMILILSSRFLNRRQMSFRK